MACQPTAMASRNWILHRMMLESIRQDPEYANGNYTRQSNSLKTASAFFAFATSGGTLNYHQQAPTRAQAEKLVDARLAAPMMRMTSFGNGDRQPITIPRPISRRSRHRSCRSTPLTTSAIRLKPESPKPQ